ncbi:MAG: hypothetical protein ACOCSE_05735 [Chitinivibrionales bacterium]
MRTFKTLIIISVILSIISCSNTGSTTAGATDNPNSFTGVAKYNSEPAANREVMLKEILVTADGDTSIEVKTTVTDLEGVYKFYNVESGKYVVYSEDFSNAGIVFGVEKGSGDLNLQQVLNIENKIVVKGRLLGAEAGSVLVSVPGTEKRTGVDSNGVYVLSGLPAGRYSIAFISAGTVNYLPIEADPSFDTVYIRDVRFAESAREANAVYKPLESAMDKSFSVAVEEYPDSAEPQWYFDKDFSGASYQEVVTLFRFDNEAGNNLWSDPNNWDPNGVPGRSDTADISSKLCIMSSEESICGCIRVFGNAELQVTGNIKDVLIEVDNSTISMNKKGFAEITGEIAMLSDSLLFETGPSESETSELILRGIVSGQGSVIKKGRGGLLIEGDTTDFEGDWYINRGEIRVRMPYALGRSDVYVNPGGRLDIENDKSLWNVDTLSVGYNEAESLYGYIMIDATSMVNYLKVDGSVISAGEYVEGDFPEFLVGENSLFVNRE